MKSPYTVVDSIRAKLAAVRGQDEYQRQTVRQNAGLYCEHCGSESGHYVNCPLINRTTAEAHSVVRGQVPADNIYAHALGVDLQG